MSADQVEAYANSIPSTRRLEVGDRVQVWTDGGPVECVVTALTDSGIELAAADRRE